MVEARESAENRMDYESLVPTNAFMLYSVKIINIFGIYTLSFIVSISGD